MQRLDSQARLDGTADDRAHVQLTVRIRFGLGSSFALRQELVHEGSERRPPCRRAPK